MQIMVCIVAYCLNLLLKGVNELLAIRLFLILLALELALGFSHGASEAFIVPDLVHIDSRDEGTEQRANTSYTQVNEVVLLLRL